MHFSKDLFIVLKQSIYTLDLLTSLLRFVAPKSTVELKDRLN